MPTVKKLEARIGSLYFGPGKHGCGWDSGSSHIFSSSEHLQSILQPCSLRNETRGSSASSWTNNKAIQTLMHMQIIKTNAMSNIRISIHLTANSTSPYATTPDLDLSPTLSPIQPLIPRNITYTLRLPHPSWHVSSRNLCPKGDDKLDKEQGSNASSSRACPARSAGGVLAPRLGEWSLQGGGGAGCTE
ncbi:hypothetical protein BDV96DRAFT_562732 [Lophiotrema nucula]|uniref:Uncharacterized protein n=1 Tax=Lophiotrema nucula TaxID=690887 RepID=A0A6A5ZUF5_9PLEO|nr:hypothetical protein BDV96DRAFT_562732 [Lophiotrema nucula]